METKVDILHFFLQVLKPQVKIFESNELNFVRATF